MKFAIVESGGKQYRAVEGVTVDVDRLAREIGDSFDFERVLLMADGDAVSVGTPTVGGITVSATVVNHLKGPKVLSFKYRPKKRIRVRGGNRAHFTRLMIDFIGNSGDKKEKPKAEPKPKAEKPAKAEKDAAKPSKPKKTASTKKSDKK
ncbi:MAG: 50S ribosomal protein L21 [Anaerolineales bacterium]|jgi:large subunit ribosomal protein L21|nr:50S ribosomal protein L21 [Chloroflexota bacterium]MBK6647750.1 50S ribosomal protein L21 [Anaerolineales bacterium]MCC6984789.1 50S ribosomal protein L21 [Anaerolineales bacterium]